MRILPIGLDHAAQLHVGMLTAQSPEQLVSEVLRLVVLGVEVDRRPDGARTVEDRTHPCSGRVQCLLARERCEERRERGGLHGHIDSWERAPWIALEHLAGRPQGCSLAQHVDQLDDPVCVSLRLGVTDDVLAEEVHGDRLALVPQPSQARQGALRILGRDELAGHAADVAAGDRRGDDAAQRHLLGDVEPQLHGPGYGHSVEVLRQVPEHVVGVTASRKHVHEAEQLCLELGVGERPLQHLLAPPAQVERSDLSAVAGHREAPGDGVDFPLERVAHLRSAMTEVRIPQHPDLEVGVFEATLHDVADADDPTELPLLDHGDMAYAPAGHLDHDVVDSVIGRAGSYRSGHHVASTQGQRVGTATGDRRDDVSLGDDALDPAPVVGDHERTDPFESHSLDDPDDRGIRRRRRHVAALHLEDVIDSHPTPPFLAPSPARARQFLRRTARRRAC